jgi:7-cyano-7-deazaguanine synthase in queuosine biosynthesis
MQRRAVVLLSGGLDSTTVVEAWTVKTKPPGRSNAAAALSIELR